jgi:peptide/nickel transport system substrate-binding protein
MINGFSLYRNYIILGGKQMSKKVNAISLLMLCLILLLTGCAPAESAAQESNDSGQASVESEYAKRITIGRLGDAAYLDPNQAVGVAEITITQQIYEGLVKASEDCKSIVPSLASDWTISEDALVYTFNLRPDIMFSDGTAVTGADWEWSLIRARDAETSGYRFAAEPIESVESDGKTVVVTLKEPSASFLGNLCMFNLTLGSKAHWDAVGEQTYAQQPLGTGPYMLEEWNKEENILLVKNPYYWRDGVPFTEELNYKVVGDDNTRSLQLQSGDIDIMMDVPFSMVSQIETSQNVKIHTFPSTQIRYFILNTTQAPLDNQKVRQAIGMAIDKQELADIVTSGFGKPAESLLSDTQIQWFFDDLEYSEYDVEAAKALLAEAGYPDGVEFTISVRSGSQVYEQVAVMLKSQLAKAGINVELEMLERASLSEKYQTLSHEATILQWVDDFPDPSGIMGWTIDYDQCYAWYTGLNDEDLDQFNAAANVELDLEKRMEMYDEIQQRIYDNANVIPLFSNAFVWAASDKVENLKVTPFYVQITDNLKMKK